jgi:hypothetical protein
MVPRLYYIAPRFSDWTEYLNFYEDGEILKNSLLLQPGQIRGALNAARSADGPHRVVYDRNKTAICSRPISLEEISRSMVAESVRIAISQATEPIGHVLKRIHSRLGRAIPVRRGDQPPSREARPLDAVPRLPRQQMELQRLKRFQNLRDRSRSDDDAYALALGLEFWGLGAQLVIATKSD